MKSLTAIAIALLVSGCGDDGKKKKTDDETSETGAVAAPKPGPTTKPEPGMKKPGARAMPSKSLIAFSLGDKLSLAATGYGAGTDKAVALRVWKKAEVLGKALGVAVPPMPTPEGPKAKRGAAMLNYLFDTAGKPIAGQLMSKVGRREAGLFELAVKTNIMRMMYFPDPKNPKSSEAGVKGLQKAAAKSGISNAVIKPVTDAMAANKPRPEVFEAISTMMKAIRMQLGAPR